jgi:DNA gyrase subunit A
MKGKEKINTPVLREKEITKEMEESYIDYAMSVIISRALPDVRDGLKPVQRRILYAMYEMGLKSDAKFRKSAAVTGEVMGKYHPHGDAPIYEALVRMAQDFSLRYPLINGQGNFGSIDGDPPAAQRYTECRLSKFGEEMLSDIEKNTVDFQPNYDGTKKEPVVLPSPIPQLILNGTLGIAVGMATNIPPHNLSEVLEALIYLLDHSKADTEDLFKFVKGPDFPTGGQVFDLKSIIETYSIGRGPILVRGKAEIIEEGKKTKIVITEIPFQVLKSNLLEQIANLIQERKIDGIRGIRDESDKEGMRIVVELKSEAQPRKILNALYKFTDLQKTFHLNMLALSGGIQPKVMGLVEILREFLDFRREIVIRRTKFDLEKAKERAHILEGIEKCLEKIEKVISLIKNSKDREEAKKRLMKNFDLDQIQANAILEMKLASLARLERKKIEDELKELKLKIKELNLILKSPEKVKEVMKKEFSELKEKFKDERKTKVFEQKVGEISDEELIPEEETIIVLTKGGYIKRVSPRAYKIQKRGGRGVIGIETNQEDEVLNFLLANTKDQLLFFVESGKVFSLPAFEIPEESRLSKGRSITNFLEISNQEKILTLLSLGKKDLEDKTKYLVTVTKEGIIKRTPLQDFKKVRRSGLIAINLKKGDLLRSVQKSTGEDDLILMTKNGMVIRFNEKEIRPMGRNSYGVKGIKLRNDEVVGVETVKEKKGKIKVEILTLTENGFGKRTDLKEYKIQKRGGLGIKAAKINQKTGKIASFKVLTGQEDLILISQKGQTMRTKISSIPKLKRQTQGVRIMKLEEGDKLVSAAYL